MAPKRVTVLVVDDDLRMLRMMEQMLQLEGYHVLTAEGGEAALAALRDGHPDVVLLDIMMPGMDGITLCRRIREFSRVPIIMVSARHSDREKVAGLDAGADDYVTKPFSAPELAARVRAVLRRSELPAAPFTASYTYRGLTVDFERRRVTVGDREVRLTAIEYGLLRYLAQNAGRIVTPDQILEAVWGEPYLGETHILHVSIARLRRKLGDSARNPTYIITRPGIGYLMPKEG